MVVTLKIRSIKISYFTALTVANCLNLTNEKRTLEGMKKCGK